MNFTVTKTHIFILCLFSVIAILSYNVYELTEKNKDLLLVLNSNLTINLNDTDQEMPTNDFTEYSNVHKLSYSINNSNSTDSDIVSANDDISGSKLNNVIIIISGEVNNPGRYSVPSDTTVINAIVKYGGGFTKNAYYGGLNLTSKVYTGKRINVIAFKDR